MSADFAYIIYGLIANEFVTSSLQDCCMVLRRLHQASTYPRNQSQWLPSMAISLGKAHFTLTSYLN